MLDHFEP
jgi:hypothetical protein